ncbi:aldo/keto reductase [Lactiplantibacillus plantarum]|uniref:aldo/keto reductase n=1 Tax=Lactobacillaceae TaxID=33958 RepID=UPI0009759F66|nr:aldo/keto reductase [Lactiplantibacillus plantarum]
MNNATFTLKNGLELPPIGFGTSGLKGSNGLDVIVSAIEHGYRLIDTAYNYENEGTVGQAIQRSSVKREEILISSKLPGRAHKYKKAIETIQESLFRSHLDYFDIYLIHWPNPNKNEYIEAWQALLDAKRFGLIRAAGVSNFLPEYLDKLNAETGELPEINQIELHPMLSQAQQIEYDQKSSILTEAWSPLGGIGMGLSQPIRQLPLIEKLSKKYKKSTGQIILRWEHQLGVLPIPLSHNYVRQKQNLDILSFSLSSAEMEQITQLDQKGARVSKQDPQTYEEF